MITAFMPTVKVPKALWMRVDENFLYNVPRIERFTARILIRWIILPEYGEVEKKRWKVLLDYEAITNGCFGRRRPGTSFSLYKIVAAIVTIVNLDMRSR